MQIIFMIVFSFIINFGTANKIIESNQFIGKMQEFEYINQYYHYNIKLPNEFYDYCNIIENEDDSEIYFNLKQSDDMIMVILTVPNERYSDEMLGTKFLGTKNGFTTYIQFPTCGTLNDENAREIWSNLVEKAHKIEENNFYYIENMV